jgi:hydrogenase maturation factor
MIDEANVNNSLAAIRCMRDPTRGGLATTLNEIALSAEVCIEIQEELIPVREEVKGACEILGLDPLYVANEGKLLAIVAPGFCGQVSGENEPESIRIRGLHHGRGQISSRWHRFNADGFWRYAYR